MGAFFSRHAQSTYCHYKPSLVIATPTFLNVSGGRDLRSPRLLPRPRDRDCFVPLDASKMRRGVLAMTEGLMQTSNVIEKK